MSVVFEDFWLSNGDPWGPAAPVGPGYAETVLADGPVAFWRMTEPSGDLVWDSMERLHGRSQGNYTRGAAGMADEPASWAHVGTDSTTYVYVGDSPLLSPQVVANGGKITIECILAPKLNGAYFLCKGGGALLGGGGGQSYEYSLAAGPTGAISFVFWTPGGGTYTGGAVAPGSLQQDVPAHFVLTYTNPYTVKIYINGTQVYSTTTAFNQTDSSGLTDTASALLIGNRNDPGWANSFEGRIQDVAIYNKILTPAQILSHATEAGLVPATVTPFAAFGIPL